MRKIVLFCLVFSSIYTYSQEVKDNIKKKEYSAGVLPLDVSNLWLSDTFLGEGDGEVIKKLPPLGFRGENFERMRIKFLSVIKDKNHPSTYFVYGKTMIKGTVSDFQGTLSVSNAEVYTTPEFEGITQGTLQGDYHFYENPNQKNTGIMKGTFTSYFFMADKNTLVYNGLMHDADGFKNNQFKGNWQSYTDDTLIVTCNWGDYRIPESQNILDTGTAAFWPHNTYLENGWLSYNATYNNYPGADIGLADKNLEKEQAKEIKKWWLQEH